ncbi:Hypothetical protein NG00_00803 [Corynebacterium camporealensis]|uniref:Uncharacterized protein n=1 Tax=Corynebacterium camporealensis TaxID=161896 RepID=A0A0F6TA76_9CORY|nr:hypothetical protein UL81_04465 [Corynebacterium camporealensis]AVH88126.1 Hypothetical protein NG00_00803 [Corynebacterium camporealensis]
MSTAHTAEHPSGRRLKRAGVLAAATAALLGLVTPMMSPAQAQAPDLSSLQQQFAASSPLDELGRPTPETAERIRAFAAQPWVPEDARNAILTALNFTTGGSNGEPGGPALPEGNNPEFRQFYWPTVSAKCINGEGNSVGSAIAVSGPTKMPAPGAGEGETVFLFTALGTATAAQNQGGMHVQWFNIDTFQTGSTPLHNNGINEDGPTTVSGRAATGKGTVLALLHGSVNTANGPCSFAPTAAILEVR